MTLTNLRQQIYANAGFPSDLNPATDTSYNSGPILTWVVNEAQRQIAFWKDTATGRNLRFRSVLAETYFQSKVVSETLDDAGSTTTAVILPSTDVGSQDDRYNGWVFEAGGDVHYDGEDPPGALRVPLVAGHGPFEQVVAHHTLQRGGTIWRVVGSAACPTTRAALVW